MSEIEKRTDFLDKNALEVSTQPNHNKWALGICDKKTVF